MISVIRQAAEAVRKEVTCQNCKSVLAFDHGDTQTLPSRPGDPPGDRFVHCPQCQTYVFAGSK